MWRWIALFSLGGATGCLPPTKYSAAVASQTSEFAMVRIGDTAGYVIDPRTQTCLMWTLRFGHEGTASGTVDCAKLKASVPEAAQYITWDAQPSKP